MPSDETEKTLTKLVTTIWGAYGTNGLNAEVRRHGKQIGELYGKTGALGEEIERRLGGIYRMLATMAVSMIIGLIAIIGTLVATQ